MNKIQLPKTFAMAMCSMVDTTGIVNSFVSIAMAMSRKLYVRFPKLVENGGGANGGKPWLIDPENDCSVLHVVHCAWRFQSVKSRPHNTDEMNAKSA